MCGEWKHRPSIYHFISFIYTHVQALLEVPISHIGVIVMSHFFTFQVLFFCCDFGVHYFARDGSVSLVFTVIYATHHVWTPVYRWWEPSVYHLNKSLKTALEWFVLISAHYRQTVWRQHYILTKHNYLCQNAGEDFIDMFAHTHTHTHTQCWFLSTYFSLRNLESIFSFSKKIYCFPIHTPDTLQTHSTVHPPQDNVAGTFHTTP